MGGNTGPQGPPAPRSHRGGRWALFAEVPGFGRFWAARATSAFGTGTAAVALLWLVSAGQAPGLDVGAVAAAELAAPSVLAPILGPLVDRLERRWLLVGTDLVRIVTTLALPFAYEHGGMPAVLPLALAQGVVSVTFGSAAAAALPELVGAQHLGPANAMLVTANQGAAVLGSALGGVLVSLNAVAPFALDAATYVASATLLATLSVASLGSREAPAAVRRVTYRRQLVEGAKAFADRRAVRVLAGLGMLATFGFAPASVALVMLVRVRLDGGGPGYGAVRAATAVGLALGAQLAPWLVRRMKSATRAMSVGYLTMGILTVALGFSPNVASAASIALVRSGANSVLGVPNTVLFQSHVPNELRGRVFTLLVALEEAPRLAILPLAGLLADHTGVRPLFLLMALPIVATAALALASRALLDDIPSSAPS
jgi:MFS family permease